MSPVQRGALQAARTVVAAAALLAWAASAQAPQDVRIALVIGNSGYPAPATLVNPANDAAAVGKALQTLGFEVVELRDGSRAQMREAMDRMRQALKGKQAIGMLYYAGHGVQVNFRNYMVPVDARLATVKDVPEQAVDVSQVIDAFRAAGTRMNILVLDACRDNPFGESSGKGLAPLDAPTGTFLAYATAPGNVAEDGDEGSGNGLYTGFLVRELQKPAARIEDVFKRVRMQVRQQSKGRQIPWESTSLEEDFYFNDGTKHTFRAEDLERVRQAALAREQALQREAEQARERERQQAAAQQLQQLRAQEAQRLKELEEAAAQARERERLAKVSATRAREEAFRVEKADWDRIKDSRDPQDFYAFLQKHPSGEISEHATAVLERLQVAQIKHVPDAAGLLQVEARDRFRLGDVYAYHVKDRYSGAVTQQGEARVTAVDEDTVTLGKGGTVLTREGGTIRNQFIARMDPPRLDLPAGDFAIGKKWSYRSLETSVSGKSFVTSGDVRITALEEVTVPAGTFKAYKVELVSFNGEGTQVRLTRWFRPDWGFPLRMEREIRPRYGAPTLELWEMTRPQRAG